MTNENQDAPRSADATPKATITIDEALKARLVELASRAGVDVDAFVEKLLRRLAETEVEFERGVPVFPRRPGARVVTVEDVNKLL
ncbi:MAG: hypothetical protein FJW23_10145 [Acidimicrobiia bacterium]|nr:hypothetical protein [Acidimicrobiia bacterium]